VALDSCDRIVGGQNGSAGIAKDLAHFFPQQAFAQNVSPGFLHGSLFGSFTR
jgi:hypothetical protein